MNYLELMTAAREKLSSGNKCKACPVCNGLACKNKIPGPGAKGIGDTAILNYDAWQKIRINMDTFCENKPVDTSLEFFGKTFKYPFFAGPIGGIALHYSNAYDDIEYNHLLVEACAKAGIAAFTGDGINPAVMQAATDAIKNNDGVGVPTIKPWNIETISEKMALANASGAFAIAMDIDAAGLPFLKNMQPPAGGKSVEEMMEIVKMGQASFIIKGIMTVKGALKAKAAGACAIVVSNHGGRVLDQCAASADVLTEIVDAVGDSMKIIVDGGIRSGADVFKALALGADAVIIARPFVTAIFGAGAEGVDFYVNKIGEELADTMAMCGAFTLNDISREMVRK